jgi:hypothetical protein
VEHFGTPIGELPPVHFYDACVLAKLKPHGQILAFDHALDVVEVLRGAVLDGKEELG